MALILAPSLSRGELLEYNRDIRPILAGYCFKCHGPDQAERQSGLRLDLWKSAIGKGESELSAIIPGRPDESELMRRIESADPSEIMPPKDEKTPLSRHQIETLRRWVKEGAAYESHWAFRTLVKPDDPKIDLPASETETEKQHSARTGRKSTEQKFRFLNEIDAFVAAKLQHEKLTMSPDAERATLLRRVTFDLTGLPPTLDEIDAFLADSSPDAYEKVVDRLLVSPQYGERMVIEWLDAARYADTNGYQHDATRTMWPWRDWVIRALNDNMPFDQFTVEQLAGDLLPDARMEQRLATGFNRNHMLNGEGGRIPEESRNDYVMDRVETVGTVWLGLTIGCCRCHDHKYDPISQREYYQLFAYFNNIDEVGRVDAGGNANPVMRVETADEEQRVAELREELHSAERDLDPLLALMDSNQKKWEEELTAPRIAKLPSTVATALQVDDCLRSEEQRKAITDYYRNEIADGRLLHQAVIRARKSLNDYEKKFPVVMVMRERADPRKTRVLIAGRYDRPGDCVEPGIPAALSTTDAPQDRLEFARWLVGPSNPLTARVIVNRYWQMFFGRGLVKTAEDFGIQGDMPSHPELLDWLAAHFVESGWNVKAMHRLIVTSATYRQSSRISQELQQRDPDNRLLARGPRFRLSSYALRDQALAVSGLLVSKVGGPPVKPYMPAGVWEDASLGKISYKPDQGEGLYRRSVYTFWRRIASPTMLFDAAARTVAVVRQSRTNTPLHALVLMNDVQQVEAARNLAARIIESTSADPQQRITMAFRLCTARIPSPDESRVLLQALREFELQFQADRDAALKLVSHGASRCSPRIAPVELATYTSVASLILNLDETVTKE